MSYPNGFLDPETMEEPFYLPEEDEFLLLAAPTTSLSSGTVYKIRLASTTNMYLNVTYGYDGDGTNVIIWPEDGSVEQRWRYSSSRLYSMCSSNGTNRVLDAYRSNGQIKSGCNADIWSPNDSQAQILSISKVSGSTNKYTIRLSASGLYLYANKTSQNVYWSSSSTAANTQWYFEPESTSGNSTSKKKDYGVSITDVSPQTLYTNTDFTVTVKYTNFTSMAASNISVEILFNNNLIANEKISLGSNGTLKKSYTINSGASTGSKAIAARINYALRASEADSTDNESTRTITVTTQPIAVDNILLSPTSMSLETGEERKLNAIFSPLNADNQTVTWRSSNTSIVTVSNTTAKTVTLTGKSIGTAKITATSNNGKVATCDVKVTPVAVKTVTISPAYPSVYLGKTIELTAAVSPFNADKTISWSSSNTGVAVFTSLGVVTGKSLGTAIITAMAVNGVKSSVTINVIPIPVNSISIKPASAAVHIGSDIQLGVTVDPPDATYKTITWSSNNSAVALVKNGVVTGLTTGTAIITATSYNGKKDTCYVLVTPPNVPIVPINSITIKPTNPEVKVGAETQLTIEYNPSNATSQGAMWSSDKVSVATVGEKTGKVKGIKAGTTTITAISNNGKVATCTITVIAVTTPVTTVYLESNTSVKVGGEVALAASTDGTNKNVTWSSSNTSIATIKAPTGTTAVIKGISAGKATITATSQENSSKKASCVVEVKSETGNVYADLGWKYFFRQENDSTIEDTTLSYGQRVYKSNSGAHMGVDVWDPREIPNADGNLSKDDENGPKLYNVCRGTVITNGTVTNYQSNGNFVTICAKNGANGKPLNIRYLHLAKPASHLKIGKEYSENEQIGILGGTGDANGINHLHFDVNTLVVGETVKNIYGIEQKVDNIYNGILLTGSTTIDPQLFFPHIKFGTSGGNGTKHTLMAQGVSNMTTSLFDCCDGFETDRFIDIRLINHVDHVAFENWTETVSQNKQTVQAYLNNFNISDAEFDDLIAKYDLQGVYKHAESMVIKPSTLNLRRGGSCTLEALFEPFEAFNKNVTWVSSNPSVAKISSDGTVTGIALGTATITATAEDGNFVSTSVVTVVASEYEVTDLSANESIHGIYKDIEVAVTYKNGTSLADTVPVELLYGGAEYLSQNIVFSGTVGETRTVTYIIKDVPCNASYPIEARVNYLERAGESNSNNNAMVLAPLDIPIPQNDYSILYIKPEPVVTAENMFTIEVAYLNNSYFSGDVPVRLRYDNGNFLEDIITFTGTPFETVVKKYTAQAGAAGLQKAIEVQINWDNENEEESGENNFWTVLVNVEQPE